MEFDTIQKVLNGETDAFGLIVKQHKDRAFTIALSIVKNEFDARDVVQDAFLNAFRKMGSFRKESAFLTWFTRILINEALKKSRKEKSIINTDGSASPDEQLAGISEGWEEIQKNERQHYVRSAIRKLPPKEALALTLFYLEDLSIEEICDNTGFSPSNVKVLLFRARKNIYVELERVLKHEIKTLY